MTESRLIRITHFFLAVAQLFSFWLYSKAAGYAYDSFKETLGGQSLPAMLELSLQLGAWPPLVAVGYLVGVLLAISAVIGTLPRVSAGLSIVSLVLMVVMVIGLFGSFKCVVPMRSF